MTVESVTYIDDLNATYPAGGDAKSEGDNHIRNLKTGIKNSFPNISGAMTATHTELNTMDGITATTAELNIMDGVTATTAELNKLDASAQAVTGFTYSNIVYVNDDISSSESFNIASAIGATFESIGPTGSGATNIWTAMDNIPSGAKWIEIKVELKVSKSSGYDCRAIVYGRKTGSSTSAGSNNAVCEVISQPVGSTGNTQQMVNTHKIALDANNRFDIAYDLLSATTHSCNMYIVSFGY